MNIVKGKQNAPIRAVVYGPEGIGKTTFASQWPAPLFVDAEGGTLRLNVDRMQPLSWASVIAAVDELAKNAQGYKTLVFDTADWLEKLLIENILATKTNERGQAQTSIEGFGYGKGFTFVEEEWKRLLDKLTAMQRANGMHVVMVAHAIMRKFEQPDEAGSYDRYELKLSKKACPIIKEWADAVLFLNYKTLVVEIDGKNKAQGGQRVIFTEHHSCWDAKNRFGLKPELPADFKAIAHLFTATPATTPQPTPAPAAPVDTTAGVLPPKNGADPKATMPQIDAGAPPAAGGDTTALVEKLKQLCHQSGVKREELQAEMARRGIMPADVLPSKYNEAVLNRVIGNWEKVVNNVMSQRKLAAAA